VFVAHLSVSGDVLRGWTLRPEGRWVSVAEEIGEEVADTELESYKIAKALVESARPTTQKLLATYENDVKWWLGENHYPVNSSMSLAIKDSYKPKTVRNYTFATIDHKAAVVLDATPRLRAEPLDSSSTLQERELAANAVRHELERCRWHEIREDMYLDASVCGVGIGMVRVEQDKLSGEYRGAIDCIDPRRFYPDPSATRLDKCQYVVYEPELDISQIKDLCDLYGCPEKFEKIKPNKSDPIGTSIPSERVTRSNAEIIAAPGNEIAIDKDNKIRSRKANVCYVWVKDDSLSTEVKKVVTGDESEGLVCLDCGEEFSMDNMACPGCGSENLSTEQEVTERAYPYGRLTVLCQDVQLYDGPNPLEIDTFFPFAVYTHHRIKTRFHGYGDVGLLKSNQMQADKNAANLFMAMALTSQGFFEFPAGELGYQHVSNEPGQKVPVKAENAGKAHWVTPQGYNGNLHQIADNTIFGDFQRISGETDQAVSQMPSAPDSATEVKSRDSVRQSRMGRHLKRFSSTCGDLASIYWQVMVQYYVGPRPFMFTKNGSQFESVVLDVSMLPRNLRIRVEADADGMEKDKLAGQNLVMAMTQGVIPMMPDIALRCMGVSESLIAEVMNRPEMLMFMQQTALAAMAGQGATPNGNPPAPPSGAGPQPQAPNNEGVN
jgi:hypothetical protein